MIRATLCLLAFLLAWPAWADPFPDRKFYTRMGELIGWIGANSDYPGTVKRLPAVAFLPDSTLNYLFFEGAAGTAYTGQDRVRAIYVEGMMFLSEDFRLGRDDYKLLHELVHHLQFEHDRGPPFGPDRPFGCKAEMEREAYELQIKFVEETGRGEVPSPLFMVVLQCRAD